MREKLYHTQQKSAEITKNIHMHEVQQSRDRQILRSIDNKSEQRRNRWLKPITSNES